MQKSWKQDEASWLEKDISEYAVGEIPSEELKKHLSGCALCKAEFDRAKRVIEALEQTGEIDFTRASHIVNATCDPKRTKIINRLDLRPSFALLVLVFAVVVSVWLVIQGERPRGMVEVTVKSTILKDAKLAAKEMGLDKVKVDFALLEQGEVDFKLDDFEFELPDENILPALTSSYLPEVLDLENIDKLLKELGIKEKDGQTGYGRLT